MLTTAPLRSAPSLSHFTNTAFPWRAGRQAGCPGPAADLITLWSAGLTVTPTRGCVQAGMSTWHQPGRCGNRAEHREGLWAQEGCEHAHQAHTRLGGTGNEWKDNTPAVNFKRILSVEFCISLKRKQQKKPSLSVWGEALFPDTYCAESAAFHILKNPSPPQLIPHSSGWALVDAHHTNEGSVQNPGLSNHRLRTKHEQNGYI